MSYDQIFTLLSCLLVVEALALLLAVTLALVAVIEMRRYRLIAAACNPAFDAHEDDALLPGTRSLVDRIRRWGGA